ncbi:MAG: hypothetical protein WC413_04410 [Candidatus Nanoarchaeia archaeon]
MILKEIKALKVKNVEYLAQGKRSIIYTGIFRNKKIAIKTEKPGISAKDRILNEAKFLKIINKYKIGPRLIISRKKFMIYEFVKGKFILDSFKDKNKKDIIKLLNNSLEQCFILDKLKINKLEMHHPVKHIIIDKKPVLIDFERSYLTNNPKNVTQFCQFIMSHPLIDILNKKGIKIDRNNFINIVKEYKRDKTEENLKKIKKEIN